ncbi:MAG TPA: endopeptidase La [Paludibacteraceae bacterium]|nr:endopeptidase La [Paludibacteraceae bacterium]
MKDNPNKLFIGTNLQNDDSDFIPLIGDEDDDHVVDLSEDKVLPILALRNMVLFPGVVIPVTIGRPKSLKLIKDVNKRNGFLGTIAQKDNKIEEPELNDLYAVGTVAQVVRVLEMPDNSTTVILQGRQRFAIQELDATEPYLKAKVELLADSETPKHKDFKALMEAIKDLSLRMIKISSNMPQEIMFAIRNIENPRFFINFISSNLGLSLIDKQSLLEINNIEQRAMMLLKILTKESQLLEMKASIQSQAMENIDKQQREYFLQQQMKTIQKELGGNVQDDLINDIKKKAEGKKWDEKVRKIAEKEIAKLETTSTHSSDYSVQLNYVQTLVDLPWNEYTKDNFNLKRAQRVLNRDHFGLDEVKDRIIDHLAVLKLKGDLKSPIICLYGPPGVGKTSLGKSIADALGRKYARISLGGLHDEAEIRGHRRTYIGAMPGRVIQNILKTNSSNPVLVLDEIDKVGRDYKGDPGSALLEVLDPEQNFAFHDNYLDVDYDLSKVLFIATANSLSSISQPLLDRMELINVTGYIVEEKIEIAMKHLIPKQLENHGIPKDAVSFSKKTVQEIVEKYTRESGVRNLEKQIAKICRRLARKIAMEEKYDTSMPISDLKEYLGTEKYTRDKQSQKEEIGIVTGLAWTSVGGEILEIETSLSKGKGGKLTLTGNLGDVMKESAMLGLEYIRAHAKDFGLNEDLFEETNVHIHVPEGAIPKDGPSAGITMATSLLSAFTKRKVKKHIAMTGEITLHGKVLPVGGIKEKILAAKRAGITDIILSHENKKNIDEINAIYIKGLTFHYVKDIKEVIQIALLK